MEVLKITHRAALLLLVLLGLLFAGCGSTGIFGRDDDENYDEYESQRTDRVTEVRGRVDRVDTRDSIIYVEASGVYRSNLQNQDDELALHYDGSTVVEYEGRTYQPSALEAGDRIVANVDDTGSRLYARDIEVTYDVTSDDRDDDRYARDDDRYARDDDRYDARDDDRDAISEVRGKVRWLDEARGILEIEDTTWGWGRSRDDRREDVIEVHFDSDTVVEYEGRRYAPRNLERGDEIQVELRDLGSRYMANEILVIASVRD